MSDAAEPQGQPQPFPPEPNSSAEPVEVRPVAGSPAPVRPLIVRQIHTPATIILAGINIAIFAAMVLIEGGNTFLSPSSELLVKWGANFGPLTSGGQPWRMLTSMFLHVGIIHIGMNMWALWQLGILVERFYGTGRFLVMYLLTGIAGSCASLLHNPFIAGAGASGAIFGILGALLSFATLQKMAGVDPRYHRIQISVLKCIAINFAIGLSIPQIDNSAHLGGLISGVVMGAVLAPVPIRGFAMNDKLRAWLGTALLTAILAGGTVLAFSRAQHDPRAQLTAGKLKFSSYMQAVGQSLQEDDAIEAGLQKRVAEQNSQRFRDEARDYVKRSEAALKQLQSVHPSDPDIIGIHQAMLRNAETVAAAANAFNVFCESPTPDALQKATAIVENLQQTNQAANSAVKAFGKKYGIDFTKKSDATAGDTDEP